MRMRGSFLEDIGGVKTARKEADSLVLTEAILKNKPIKSAGSSRLVKLAKKNKVLLRAAAVLQLPATEMSDAKRGVDEAMRLYDLMSNAFETQGLSFAIIKTFDSMPDVGHDVDFLVSSPREMAAAKFLLLGNYKADPQGRTHCDKLLGKFSCFLPGFKHDFELYPTISQLGETHLDPARVMKDRQKAKVEGRGVWLTSDPDRVLIRVIHAMFRHNFLKLSDILDFLELTRGVTPREVLDRVENAHIQEAFLFYLASIGRFLSACQFESARFAEMSHAAEKRFGADRLGLFRRDRLVLPYRIPTMGLVMLFLLKGARDASSGRRKSALKCLVAPPLIVIDFVSAAFRSSGRGMVW
ncbi:hypothetical protein AUG19_03000 [archaeon 13_1_20CM_2_54_9]|nr:MAG: hypothetical protein AUG19_03000 [archaeon 13_1_20CM_2_54_9]